MGLRVGLVGLAQAESFIDIFNSHPGVEVTAICDIDEERLKRVGDEHDIDLRFTDFQDLAEAKLDIVEISTPIQVHGEQAIAALANGKHVLCQYIAASDRVQAHELLEAWRSSGKCYMTIETDCYEARNRTMMEMAGRGLLGNVLWGRGHYVHDCKDMGYRSDGSLTWRGELWRRGMGGLAAGVHTTLPLLKIFRETVESVYALGSGPRQRPEFGWSDAINALCRFTSGRWIEIQWDVLSYHPGLRGYYLQGTKGCFDIDRAAFLDGNSVSPWKGLVELRTELGLDAAEDSGGHGSSFQLCIGEFLDAVASGEAPPCDIFDALHVTALGWAIDESMCTGRPARVPQFPP